MRGQHRLQCWNLGEQCRPHKCRSTTPREYAP
jgi:hypothetical protein